MDSADVMPKTPNSARKTPSVCSAASNSSQSAANVIAESMKAAAQTLQQSKKSSVDEFHTFGMYLASELRALDNIAMARRVKMKLNRYFLDTVESEQQQLQQQLQQPGAHVLYLENFDMNQLNQNQ